MVYKSPFPPVPISNESLPVKLLRAIWKHGELQPKKHAIITAEDPTKCLTFHEFHKEVHRVRSFLRLKGFRQEEVACLVLSNCVEWAVFQLGAMAAGGAVSGASALFTDYELSRQFLDSRCSLIFTDEEHLEKVLKAVEECKTVKTIICIRDGSSSDALPNGVCDWKEVIACEPDYDIANVDPRSMAALPYSSGTTGSPKGVMLSHSSIGTSIDLFIAHFDREFFSVIGPKNHSYYDDHVIVHLPMYHMFGFGVINISLVSGAFGVLAAGNVVCATSVIMERFDPEVFLGAIQTYRPRALLTVPPVLVFLSKYPIVKEFDCSSIEIVMCGAAPMGRDVCEEFLSQHRNVKYLCQAYGMTECTMGSHLPTLDGKHTYMGVGKAASNVEMKIVDVVTGKEVGVGERGELWVRTPTVMMGYLNRPEATAETIDKEGWLHTGDIGYMDADGLTYIVDRLKELIKVKGLQVPPAELEDLLLSHPKVRDAAVIGIPDKRMGELVRAYIVPVDDSLTEDEVVQFVANKVSSYKRITGGVKFVDEVPRAPSGKILRRVLREEIANEAKAKI